MYTKIYLILHTLWMRLNLNFWIFQFLNFKHNSKRQWFPTTFPTTFPFFLITLTYWMFVSWFWTCFSTFTSVHWKMDGKWKRKSISTVAAPISYRSRALMSIHLVDMRRILQKKHQLSINYFVIRLNDSLFYHSGIATTINIIKRVIREMLSE